ncbi:MAG: hypothetical protein KGI50_07885, partial [Patescibacteria group bacterium]|nr:hypothetical protein [Patescibacteria group bacterium]
SGKTTLAAGVATLTVKDKKGFVFVALGDNTNSYELASMPLMNLPKCKGTYEILTKKLRIPPRGFPLLMLNVVESLDELENVPLTKYDRVLVVPAHDFFKFDFQILVDELESIAREPEFKGEYNGPRGIIACRNIRRRVKASKKSKEVSVEIAVASQLLNNFGDWRTAPKGNHMSIPVRIQFDEGGRAGANIVSSSEQSFLKGIIEQLSEDSRKWNIGLDFLTNLVVEVNKTLRELAMNVFFGRLEVQSQEAKSPLDSLLGSFSIEEVEKENVKDLTKNGYLRSGTHLMFWYNKDLGSINMIQPVIPPFQSRIEDTSNYELQKAYVEEYKATDYFVDKPLKIWYAGSEKMEESSKSEVTLL